MRLLSAVALQLSPVSCGRQLLAFVAGLLGCWVLAACCLAAGLHPLHPLHPLHLLQPPASPATPCGILFPDFIPVMIFVSWLQNSSFRCHLGWMRAICSQNSEARKQKSACARGSARFRGAVSSLQAKVRTRARGSRLGDWDAHPGAGRHASQIGRMRTSQTGRMRRVSGQHDALLTERRKNGLRYRGPVEIHILVGDTDHAKAER